MWRCSTVSSLLTKHAEFLACDLHPVSPRLRAALGRWSFLLPMQLALNCLDQPAPHADANHCKSYAGNTNATEQSTKHTQLDTTRTTPKHLSLGVVGWATCAHHCVGLTVHSLELSDKIKERCFDHFPTWKSLGSENLEVAWKSQCINLSSNRSILVPFLIRSSWQADTRALSSSFIDFSCVCRLL